MITWEWRRREKEPAYVGLRDLTPHVGRIIYFHVIKANINKA
jgi:hypothetical protein